MKKYYFYTIVGKSSRNFNILSHWTYVSETHPLQQLLNIKKSDKNDRLENRIVHYSNYWILNSGELTEEEYNLYKNKFEN